MTRNYSISSDVALDPQQLNGIGKMSVDLMSAGPIVEIGEEKGGVEDEVSDLDRETIALDDETSIPEKPDSEAIQYLLQKFQQLDTGHDQSYKHVIEKIFVGEIEDFRRKFNYDVPNPEEFHSNCKERIKNELARKGSILSKLSVSQGEEEVVAAILFDIAIQQSRSLGINNVGYKVDDVEGLTPIQSLKYIIHHFGNLPAITDHKSKIKQQYHKAYEEEVAAYVKAGKGDAIDGEEFNLSVLQNVESDSRYQDKNKNRSSIVNWILEHSPIEFVGKNGFGRAGYSDFTDASTVEMLQHEYHRFSYAQVTKHVANKFTMLNLPDLIKDNLKKSEDGTILDSNKQVIKPWTKSFISAINKDVESNFRAILPATDSEVFKDEAVDFVLTQSQEILIEKSIKHQLNLYKDLNSDRDHNLSYQELTRNIARNVSRIFPNYERELIKLKMSHICAAQAEVDLKFALNYAAKKLRQEVIEELEKAKGAKVDEEAIQDYMKSHIGTKSFESLVENTFKEEFGTGKFNDTMLQDSLSRVYKQLSAKKMAYDISVIYRTLDKDPNVVFEVGSKKFEALFKQKVAEVLGITASVKNVLDVVFLEQRAAKYAKDINVLVKNLQKNDSFEYEAGTKEFNQDLQSQLSFYDDFDDKTFQKTLQGILDALSLSHIMQEAQKAVSIVVTTAVENGDSVEEIKESLAQDMKDVESCKGLKKEQIEALAKLALMNVANRLVVEANKNKDKDGVLSKEDESKVRYMSNLASGFGLVLKGLTGVVVASNISAAAADFADEDMGYSATARYPSGFNNVTGNVTFSNSLINNQPILTFIDQSGGINNGKIYRNFTNSAGNPEIVELGATGQGTSGINTASRVAIIDSIEADGGFLIDCVQGRAMVPYLQPGSVAEQSLQSGYRADGMDGYVTITPMTEAGMRSGAIQFNLATGNINIIGQDNTGANIASQAQGNQFVRDNDGRETGLIIGSTHSNVKSTDTNLAKPNCFAIDFVDELTNQIKTTYFSTADGVFTFRDKKWFDENSNAYEFIPITSTSTSPTTPDPVCPDNVYFPSTANCTNLDLTISPWYNCTNTTLWSQNNSSSLLLPLILPTQELIDDYQIDPRTLLLPGVNCSAIVTPSTVTPNITITGNGTVTWPIYQLCLGTTNGTLSLNSALVGRNDGPPDQVLFLPPLGNYTLPYNNYTHIFNGTTPLRLQDICNPRQVIDPSNPPSPDVYWALQDLCTATNNGVMPVSNALSLNGTIPQYVNVSGIPRLWDTTNQTLFQNPNMTSPYNISTLCNPANVPPEVFWAWSEFCNMTRNGMEVTVPISPDRMDPTQVMLFNSDNAAFYNGSSNFTYHTYFNNSDDSTMAFLMAPGLGENGTALNVTAPDFCALPAPIVPGPGTPVVTHSTTSNFEQKPIGAGVLAAAGVLLLCCAGGAIYACCKVDRVIDGGADDPDYEFDAPNPRVGGPEADRLVRVGGRDEIEMVPQ